MRGLKAFCTSYFTGMLLKVCICVCVSVERLCGLLSKVFDWCSVRVSRVTVIMKETGHRVPVRVCVCVCVSWPGRDRTELQQQGVFLTVTKPHTWLPLHTSLHAITQSHRLPLSAHRAVQCAVGAIRRLNGSTFPSALRHCWPLTNAHIHTETHKDTQTNTLNRGSRTNSMHTPSPKSQPLLTKLQTTLTLYWVTVGNPAFPMSLSTSLSLFLSLSLSHSLIHIHTHTHTHPTCHWKLEVDSYLQFCFCFFKLFSSRSQESFIIKFKTFFPVNLETNKCLHMLWQKLKVTALPSFDFFLTIIV